MRKSFNLYFDSLDVLEELTNDQIAELFKAIVAYENDGTEILSGLMKAVFTPFKNNTDRAKAEYIRVCERNKANGSKGGRKKAKKPSGLESHQVTPDKDKDKDKDKDIPNGIDSNAWGEWVQHRKEIKKTLTKSTITKQQKFLLLHQEHHIAIINQSIQNGWAGLFELKEQQQRPQQQNMSFKQQDSQNTDNALDAFLEARENGFDLRNVNNGQDYQDVEVIEA